MGKYTQLGLPAVLGGIWLVVSCSVDTSGYAFDGSGPTSAAGGSDEGQAGNGATASEGGTAGDGGGGLGGAGGTAANGGQGGAAGETTITQGGATLGGSAGAAGSLDPTTGGTGDAGSGGLGGDGGTATTGGTAATGGSGGAGNLISLVAKALDGQMMLGQCQQALDDPTACLTAANCPSGTQADLALRGLLTTDRTVTLGGDTSKTYTITLHIQGEVEAKEYTGGDGDISETTVSTKMNGWHVGGTPNQADAYNVYMLRVSKPSSDYFLNDLINAQSQALSNHTTYLIDYTASLKAQGGATVRLVASDSNCNMIKNCGSPYVPGHCANPLKLDSPEPKAVSLNPSFDFSKAFDGQWLVMVVTSVTQD